MKRFLWHSLWVVLPFCALAGLSWNAWRADANTRRSRLLESAKQGAERALETTRNDLGAWSSIPGKGGIETPPVPDNAFSGDAARQRYEAGDYEGVLGSPDSVRSSAGLPLRALGALQLLRRETDPARLGELANILTGSLDFASPPFLEETERRFAELKIPIPVSLADWREKWQRAGEEIGLAAEFQKSKSQKSNTEARASWIPLGDRVYLVETGDTPGQWRIHEEPEVRAKATKAHDWESRWLADGLAITLSVAGKTVAGPTGKFPFFEAGKDGWKAQVVIADEGAYLRSEIRTRNMITAVIGVAGLAVVFGLVLSGRGYLRAVELARRQSEFMAAVSHEMRTPLAAMRLLAENLESGVAERAGQAGGHVKMIREECTRLGDLVGNVLAFTRKGKEGSHEAFDVTAMMVDAASFVSPMATERGISFAVEAEEFPEPPHGDVEALRRALLNLLDNALKHTPAGGRIRCAALPLDRGNWCIEVSDSGPGVPMRERKRIFDAFYRIGDELRRATPGTGLGLALVKRTADAHGGTVEVNDAAGGGACFTMTLQLRPPLDRKAGR